MHKDRSAGGLPACIEAEGLRGPMEGKIYIWCPRLKSNGKRALEVCRECKHRHDCRSYQDTVQPQLFRGKLRS
jgi:hypothetical protein